MKVKDLILITGGNTKVRIVGTTDKDAYVEVHPKNITISDKITMKHELFDSVIDDLCKQPFPAYLF